MDFLPPKRAYIASQEQLVDYKISELSSSVTNARLELQGTIRKFVPVFSSLFELLTNTSYNGHLQR